EGLVEGVRVTLNGQARDALQRTRTAIANAQSGGIDIGEVSSKLSKAEADFQAGRPGSVLDAVGLVNHTLSERRRNRQLEEQRIALEKARPAATSVITVKMLIESLRKKGHLCPQGLFRSSEGIATEGAGDRTRPDRGDPKVDHGPVASRHLDPRGGASPVAGGRRVRVRPFRGGPRGARGDGGNGPGDDEGS